MAPPAVVGFADLLTEALDEIARRVGRGGSTIGHGPWRRALKTTRLRLLGRRHGRLHHMFELKPRQKLELRPVVKLSPYPYHIDRADRHYTQRCPVETVVDDEVARSRIIGCSHGWAVIVDDDTWAMSLLDPFTGRSKQRREPTGGTTRFWRHMFRKAALAPGRRLGTCAVMLLHSNGRGLSYLARGATSWATLRPPPGMPHKYMDVIFHKGGRPRRLTSPLPGKAWAVLTESMSRDGILMVTSTETRENKYEVHRCVESERRWPASASHAATASWATLAIPSVCKYLLPPQIFRNGGSISHWFVPYVARLAPAF
ncbi:hypothetical protein VPH35_084632 [Triticum aestivum]